MDSLWNLVREYGVFYGVPLMFILSVLWIYRRSAKKRYHDDARIPFEGGEKDAE